MTERERLLRKASQCYLNSGLVKDASRCYKNLNDYAKLASLYEELGQWEQAAQAYSDLAQEHQQIQAWIEAARCFQQCKQYVEAAQCYINAGENLQAAWLFAEYANQFQHAQTLLKKLKATSLVDKLSQAIINARCLLGKGDTEQASQHINDVIQKYETLNSLASQQKITEWTLKVMGHLNRPDLTASLYALAYTAGIIGIEDHWENWAIKTLGDASGIPLGMSME